MVRCCSDCGTVLGPQDRVPRSTRKLEADRRSAGLEGVRFRYYLCGECDTANIFVDVLPLEGESDEALQRRWDELEESVGPMRGEDVRVVVGVYGSPEPSLGW
jgi:hypothetical protein